MITGILIVLLFGSIGTALVLKKDQFGAKVSAEDLKQYEQSIHWKNGKFENLIETTMDVGFKDTPALLREQYRARKIRAPHQKIPLKAFDAEAWNSESDSPKFCWFGHSALLIQIEGRTILIDPMMGDNASPIAPFKTARFSDGSLDLLKSLPDPDLILITHDHYDHLDLESIRVLQKKPQQWLVGMGVGRHLKSWGVQSSEIREFDWWQDLELEGLKITFTPSRHFSGRGATDRAKSFWGGWVIESSKHKIYWSGDGGYGPHFKEVGNRFGPFDWGFMECGQYNERWRSIHLFPDEAVQAALDAQVKKAIPVHWGGFALAMHSWKEPVEYFLDQAEKDQLPTSTPMLGEINHLGSESSTKWWDAVADEIS